MLLFPPSINCCLVSPPLYLISSHWTNGFCISSTLSLLHHFPIIFFISNCLVGCFAGTFLSQNASCDYLWLQLSNIFTLTGSLWAGGDDVQTLLTQSSRRLEFKTEVRHHPAHPSIRHKVTLSLTPTPAPDHHPKPEASVFTNFKWWIHLKLQPRRQPPPLSSPCPPTRNSCPHHSHCKWY